MKVLISLLLITGLSSFSTVRKMNVSYSKIISYADLIVEGEITKVSNFVYEYDFHINDFIKGSSNDNITIDMWKEWTCDSRIKSPRIGQRLLLFLSKNSNGEYEIIHGSTGELFISENNTLETFGKTDFPSLKVFKKGIQMFIKAYSYDGDLYSYDRNKIAFKTLLNPLEIEKMIGENEFFKTMSLNVQERNRND